MSCLLPFLYGTEHATTSNLYFASPDNCREYLVAHRWPDGVTCPRCGSKKVYFKRSINRWQCGSKHALRQFTSKTGTIFEDSPLGLDKWLLAMWQVVNCKNGVSSHEIGRACASHRKLDGLWITGFAARLECLRLINCPATSRRTKLLSAARRAICTSANGNAASLVLVARINRCDGDS